jgi:hypothetical protein
MPAPLLLVSAAVEAPARDRLWVLRFRHRRAGQLTGGHGYCQAAVGASGTRLRGSGQLPPGAACRAGVVGEADARGAPSRPQVAGGGAGSAEAANLTQSRPHGCRPGGGRRRCYPMVSPSTCLPGFTGSSPEQVPDGESGSVSLHRLAAAAVAPGTLCPGGLSVSRTMGLKGIDTQASPRPVRSHGEGPSVTLRR